MTEKRFAAVGVSALCALGAVACGDGGSRSYDLPWEEPRTQVIDADRNTENYGTPEGEDCIAVESAGDVDVCVSPQDECGEDQSADVILGQDGEVLEVICYFPGDMLTVEEVEADDGYVAQNENNAVIQLDDVDDGADIEGDVSVEGNNVVIYGDGPEVSQIDGNLEVDGNNFIVHGVTVTGSVDVPANNAYLVNCVIEGDITLTGNNTILAACDIFGNVTIVGNNTVLVGNRITGTVSDQGKNTECEESSSADDANDDGTITEEEVGEAISCGGGDDGTDGTGGGGKPDKV